VLRSWESRSGTRLLRIGGDAILQVLVERARRARELARQVVAEHYAFADEVAGTDGTVTSIAGRLVGAPVWQLVGLNEGPTIPLRELMPHCRRATVIA
jgi:hypothetical protein